MKKTLLALALLASAAPAFATDGPKPTAKATKQDHCTGASAAMCSKGMAGTSLAGMPACCRAKMAARAAATTTASAAKPVGKSL